MTEQPPITPITASATVVAAKVRAGDWLLIDGYVREVVRVETAATPAQSSDSGDAAGGEILLRVCFLNGSHRIVPHNHAFEVTRRADTARCAVPVDQQPGLPSAGRRTT